METLVAKLMTTKLHRAIVQCNGRVPNDGIEVEIFNLTVRDYSEMLSRSNLNAKERLSMKVFELFRDSLNRAAQTGRTDCDQEEAE